MALNRATSSASTVLPPRLPPERPPVLSPGGGAAGGRAEFVARSAAMSAILEVTREAGGEGRIRIGQACFALPEIVWIPRLAPAMEPPIHRASVRSGLVLPSGR